MKACLMIYGLGPRAYSTAPLSLVSHYVIVGSSSEDTQAEALPPPDSWHWWDGECQRQRRNCRVGRCMRGPSRYHLNSVNAALSVFRCRFIDSLALSATALLSDEMISTSLVSSFVARSQVVFASHSASNLRCCFLIIIALSAWIQHLHYICVYMLHTLCNSTHAAIESLRYYKPHCQCVLPL